jgi:flavin reductase (DIM6/NTAB) family NADH-FMN oxidoreductase RutF
MARVPSAVAIVSAPADGGPAGATANAVTSLSLDPPLMLACLDRGSRTLALIVAARRFGISYLGADGDALARAFATKDPHEEKWRDAPRVERKGVPIIEGALAWMACELRDLHEGGDHSIVTGEVVELGSNDAAPLVFWDGGYRPLEEAGGGPPDGSP